MARMRTVKPGFFTSEGVAPGLPFRTRLFFVGLWTYCDDHGRGKDNVRLIKADVWPLDDDVTLEVIDRDLDALVRSGHVVRYGHEGVRYLAVQNWHFHQKPNHPTPTQIPDPPTRIAVPEPGQRGHCAACWTARLRLTESSRNSPGSFRENSVGYPQSPGQTFTEHSVNDPGSVRVGGGGGEGGEKEGESAEALPPPPRCAQHVDNPSPGPCGPCKDARLTRKAWDALAGERAQEALLAQRKCVHCDADGYRYQDGTRVPMTPYVRCDHRPLRSVS